MNNSRLTKRIFDVVNNSVNKTNWFKEIEEELKQVGISRENINERDKYRNKIMNAKFVVKERKKTGKIWTEQRKQEHSERMKRFWEERRKTKKC